MFLAEALSAQEIAYIVMITSAFEAKHSIDATLALFKLEKDKPVHTVLTHAYLGFFRRDCNDTHSDWNFLPLLPKALLPQTRDEGPLRVSTSLAVSKEFWKVSRAFLICSLTALIINWGAIVPGQLSTVYSAPSLGLAELTQSCPFNFRNWQLLLTFMWKWSAVPKSGYVWRNSDAVLYVTAYVKYSESSYGGQLGWLSISCVLRSISQ